MAQAGELQVPSGQDVEFLQEIEAEGGGISGDTLGKSTHFRFVSPSLSRDHSYEDVAQDLIFLCNQFAIPRIEARTGSARGEVVISVATEPTEFGAITPDIPKFFESFVVQDGSCEWGDF